MNLKLSRENIWLLLICLTLCSFAFSERINSWGIIFLGSFFLIDKNLVQKIKSKGFNKKLLPPIGFFLLYLLFYLFSDMTGAADHALFSKFSFFLLPLIFFYENYFTKKNEKIILLAFSLALSLGFLYELHISLYTNYFTADHPSFSRAFNRMEVSKAIMHPGYYSNYFMFGIIWYYFNKSKYTIPFIALFTLALVLLLSRTILIFYFVFALFVAYQYTKNSARPLISGIVLLLIGIIACLGLYQIPTIKSRVVDTITKINNTSTKVDITSATDSRRITYAEEIKLVTAKPIIGYGLGNSTIVLREHLIKNGYVELGKEMNNHNQYFKTWMQLGILGFVSLVGLILFLFKYFRKFCIFINPVIISNILYQE